MNDETSLPSYDKVLVAGGISGSSALQGNVDAVISLAKEVQTTYGPRGRDKLFMDKEGNITVTNDGATVLKLLQPSHPAAKLVVDLSKAQDVEVGDGTTSVVLLCAALLKQAMRLVQSSAYQTNLITTGFKKALQFINNEIEKIRFSLLKEKSDELDYDLLKKIISVPFNSKILYNDREFFADMVLQVVKKFGNKFTPASIQILQIPGSSLRDSTMIDGIAFKRTFSYAGYEQQAKLIQNPRILFLNHEIELKHQKEFARLVINSVSEYDKFVETEWKLVHRKLEQIAETGCDLVLDIQPIGDLATQWFLQEGITNISRIPKDIFDSAAKATGGIVQSSLESLLPQAPEASITSSILGTCELYEEKAIADERYCILSGCNSQVHTLIMRGSSEEILNEAQRSLSDAIKVCASAVRHPYYLLGGGATEMRLQAYLEDVISKRRQSSNSKFDAKIDDCIKAFCAALEDVVFILADNSGLESASLIAELRQRHQMSVSTPSCAFGLDISKASVADMLQLGVLEPLRVKQHAIAAATEAACSILSIDYVIVMPQLETEEERSQRIANELKTRKQAERQWKEGLKSQRKELTF